MTFFGSGLGAGEREVMSKNGGWRRRCSQGDAELVLKPERDCL